LSAGTRGCGKPGGSAQRKSAAKHGAASTATSQISRTLAAFRLRDRAAKDHFQAAIAPSRVNPAVWLAIVLRSRTQEAKAS
jgi:hypothetical protein